AFEGGDAGAAPRCDTAAEPETHAIVVGASDAGPPFGRLTGPDNDAAALSASLDARGVADANLHVLARSAATRQRVVEAMKEVIAGVNCGDRVLFYFGGNAARSYDLIDEVIPPRTRERFEDITIDDKWLSDFGNQTHLPTIAVRWAQRNDLFLAL